MSTAQRPTTLEYESGQASALVVIVLFAVISLLTIFSVFVRYSWDPLMALAKHRRDGSQHHSRAFFHTQLGAYIASLMVSNALSSISMIVNAEWASARVVSEGSLCSTQGILSQMGDTGGAYFTGTIAIHTFNTLVLRNKLPGWFCLAATAFGWLIAVLSAAAPVWIHDSLLGPVYGINNLSCGISLDWPLENTTLHLLPLLLGSLVSVLFYTLVFLVLRGTLTFNGGLRISLDRTHRWSMSSITTAEYQRFIAAIARSMLWYPFAYNILLLPEVIVSLTKSSGINVPFQASVFASTAASLLGTANGLILINTLRILRPFLEGNLQVPGIVQPKFKEVDMESFYAGMKSPAGFSVVVKSPRNPDKAFVNSKRESKREWSPPLRTVSKPTAANPGTRVSQVVPKRKAPQPNPIEEAVSVSRPITPVAELNAMITVPPQPVRKNTLPATPRLPGASPSLPAPRRETRSPLIRQPTLQADPSPIDAPFTTITLASPEAIVQPPAAPKKTHVKARSIDSGRTSASDSLLSMYLSRSPEQMEMDPPAPPPKPLPAKPRPTPMPLSARTPVRQNTLGASPLPTLRSARAPANYAPDQETLANNERVRRGAAAPALTPSTLKAERRRSRSLDLTSGAVPPRTPAAARTPVYGNTLPVQTPRRGASMSPSPLSARAPTSARRAQLTPGRQGTGSQTPGGYGYL